MYPLIKRNWDKTKPIVLFALTATLLLLLTVVYKSDEKITKKSDLIKTEKEGSDLINFKKFLLNQTKPLYFFFKISINI